MPRSAVIAILLALAAVAGAQQSDDSEATPPEIPAELRETLPGGSRAGTARELPGAVVDLLPRPTKLELRVRRAAEPDRKR